MEKLQFREVIKPVEVEETVLLDSVMCTRKTKDDVREIANKSDLPMGKVAERLLRFAIENIEWVSGE